MPPAEPEIVVEQDGSPVYPESPVTPVLERLSGYGFGVCPTAKALQCPKATSSAGLEMASPATADVTFQGWQTKVRVASCGWFAKEEASTEPEMNSNETLALQTFCRLLTDANYQHLEIHDFNIGIRVYQKWRLFDTSTQVLQGPNVPLSTVKYLRHIFGHATKAYGPMISVATAVLALSDMGDEREYREVDRQRRNAVFHPAYRVVIEKALVPGNPCDLIEPDRLHRGRVVVAIRGTLSIDDALTDVAAQPVEAQMLQGAEVHAGILLAATNLLQSIQQAVVEALREHPDYDLVVTGHSLGGGTATVLTLLMRNSPEPLLRRATCVAFGPPPVIRGHGPREFDDFLETVVNDTDIVCRLTIPSIMLLLQAADYAHSLPWWKQGLLAVRMDWFMDLDSVAMKPPTEADEARRLFIPGKVYQMRAVQDTGRWQLTRIPNTELSYVAGSDRMLLDHMPWAYQEGFTKVLEVLTGRSRSRISCW